MTNTDMNNTDRSHPSFDIFPASDPYAEHEALNRKLAIAERTAQLGRLIQDCLRGSDAAAIDLRRWLFDAGDLLIPALHQGTLRFGALFAQLGRPHPGQSSEDVLRWWLRATGELAGIEELRPGIRGAFVGVSRMVTAGAWPQPPLHPALWTLFQVVQRRVQLALSISRQLGVTTGEFSAPSLTFASVLTNGVREMWRPQELIGLVWLTAREGRAELAHAAPVAPGATAYHGLRLSDLRAVARSEHVRHAFRALRSGRVTVLWTTTQAESLVDRAGTFHMCGTDQTASFEPRRDTQPSISRDRWCEILGLPAPEGQGLALAESEARALAAVTSRLLDLPIAAQFATITGPLVK